GRKNGVGVAFQNNKIRPVDGDDGSGTNNTVSLGEPTYKFKDLYLEGDIHIDSDVGQLRIGADEDLKIDHNGSNAYFMNGTGSTLNRAADHVFENGDGSTEHVRIKSDGKVGIGTNNPASKLHISGDGAGQNTLRIDTSTTAISFNNHSEFMGFMGNDSGKLFINAGGTERTLSLRTVGVERLRISSGGNVGIGTDNPTDVLDINSSQASAVSDVYIRNHANLGGAALNLFTQGTYSSPTY
ncbi:MAG: hypothetical protein VXY93_15760, partial [Pseudomonadota bacterium]|nr:hypothetical protein [Pseudomonadota bacterium]